MMKFFEFIYQGISRLRNYFYDRDWLESVQLDRPVVSVGNLSFGGTGKTPCLIFLAEKLSPSLKVAIICRSYKTQAIEPQRVDATKDRAAQIFGDEACLLQKRLPQCVVWSGPRKYRTAQAALVKDHPQLILIDDGFSHRRLKRNFDLVLVDATKGTKDYWREGLNSLKRAHAVVITKTNLVGHEQVEHLKRLILRSHPHLQNVLFESQTQTVLNISKTQPLFIFCGLAHPESFRVALEQQGFKIHTFIKRIDHAVYTESEQAKIYEQFQQVQRQIPSLQLVTTEKDRVKLTNQNLLKEVHVTSHQFVMSNTDEVGLLEKIRTTL